MIKILKILLATVISSLLFLVLGFIISSVIDSPKGSLGTVLFIIGGVLIVFFSPGLFSNSSSGALHTPVVVYRLVNTVSKKSNKDMNSDGALSYFFSSLSLVLAGVMLWGVSYFV